MLTEVSATTQFGTTIDLPMASDEIVDSPFQIRNIVGLGPVKANITTTPFATFDGDVFTGASVGKRNIVITIGLNPNWVDESVESLRAQLYTIFMPKQYIILHFTSTHMPTVEITGYVESNEPNIFSKDPEVQISIICPEPDFVDYDTVHIAGIVDTDSADPVIFDYDGTTFAGITVTINSSVANVAYTGAFNLLNASMNDMELEFSGTVDATHRIVAVTIPGSKRITQTTLPSGPSVSILSSLLDGSGWPLLKPGENRIAVVAAEAGQTYDIAFDRRYGGI